MENTSPIRRALVRGTRVRRLVASVLVMAWTLALASPASAWPTMGC